MTSSPTITVTCPSCGHEFPLSEAVLGSLREGVRKELSADVSKREHSLEKKLAELRSREEQIRKQAVDLDAEIQKQLAVRLKQAEARARKQAEDLLGVKLHDLQSQLAEKSSALKTAQEQELELRREQRRLKEQREAFELEMARKLDAERSAIREQVAVQLDEQNRLKFAEREKIITDLRREMEILQRKAAQGSQQTQGEVMELDLTANLGAAFPADKVEEVSKGVRGADIAQSVISPTGRDCGIILYESKRTKNWSDAWVPKLKEDMRNAKAELGVIVTETLPEGIKRFGLVDGVWVTDYASVRLTDQTLHTAIADFLDPKLKSLEHEISAQRSKPGGGGAKLGELLEFQGELLELKSELERVIKLPWKPNLNDGVLITASPLWKLFRLSKWQKDLKACWEELEAGTYDWAHLAYSIWPKRVEKVCETDRSIAIAHSLEHLCKVAPPKPKKERKAKKSADLDEELEGLETEDSTASKSRPKGPKAQGTKGPSKAAAVAPRTVEERGRTSDDEERTRINIEDTDRNDVMCLIRQTFGQGGARDRETALKQLSEALGYQRLGTKVREILDRDLLTAVRRGILTNDDGLLRLTTSSIHEFTRDSLKGDFLAAIGYTWQDREEAIRSFARFLGYARIGPAVEEVARSLINGLLRDGRLESDGPNIRRV